MCRGILRTGTLLVATLAGAAAVYVVQPATPPPSAPTSPLPTGLFELLRTREISSEVVVTPATQPTAAIPVLFSLLVVTTQSAQPLYVCPSSAAEKDTFGGGTNAALNRSNFTDIRKNLSYSYANPFPNSSARAVGDERNSSQGPEFQLMPDINPGPQATTAPGR